MAGGHRPTGRAVKPERLDPGSRGDLSQPMAAARTPSGDFVVRADAVAWSGNGIVIVEEAVGPSTLASQLIALGATPIAQGRTVFTGHGMIRSFDRNAPPLPATLLIVTSYAPDAVWAPVVRQGALAVLSLLEHASAFGDDPQTALSLAAKLASAGVVALHGSRPDAPSVARAVLECADRLSSGLPPLAALGCRPHRSRDEAEQRRLAAAVRADDAPALAALEAPTDAAQHRGAAELHVDVVEANERVRGHGRQKLATSAACEFT